MYINYGSTYKTLTFRYCLPNSQRVKPAQPAKPLHLTPMLLMELCGRPRQNRLLLLLLLLLFTRPLPRDGGMAGDHEAPEAGKLARVWTRGRNETESRQRVSDAKSP